MKLQSWRKYRPSRPAPVRQRRRLHFFFVSHLSPLSPLTLPASHPACPLSPVSLSSVACLLSRVFSFFCHVSSVMCLLSSVFCLSLSLALCFVYGHNIEEVCLFLGRVNRLSVRLSYCCVFVSARPARACVRALNARSCMHRIASCCHSHTTRSNSMSSRVFVSDHRVR